MDVSSLTESFGGTFGLKFLDDTTFTQSGTLYTSGDWSFDTQTGTLTVIPEPGTLALVGMSLLALAVFRRKK